MKKSLIKLFLLTIVICFFCGTAFARDELKKDRRLETKYTFESLSPNDIYGNWHSLDVGFYNTVEKDFTYFLGLGAFTRDSGDAALGNIGAYKDWHSRIYTYSSLSAGTNSGFLPQFRADNDFNFKLGPDKNILWTVGVSYIKYFDVHEDFILSTGLTFYLDEWILGYRIFRNDSDPGNVTSYTHLANIGYGREGWQWTYLDGSYGKQAYLATHLTTPEQINQNAYYFNVKHRRWIKNGFGIMLAAGYFKLEDGYEKYLVSPGFFKEF